MAVVEQLKPDFGAKMKRLREERGVTLRQIADATKISVGALQALERDDISRLPGGIFSRAFVRSYAAEVGLDPEQTVRDFMLQFPHESVTAGSSPHAHAPHDGRARGRRSRAAAVLLVALVSLSILISIALFVTLSR